MLGFVPASSSAQDVLHVQPQVEFRLQAESERRSPALELQFDRAERAWNSGGSFLEAKTRLDRVIAALPGDVEARLLRAKVLLALDRPEDAIIDAERAAELRPQSPHTWLTLAEAARKRGNEAQAREALDEAARHAGRDAALHIRLSWNAQMLGQEKKAEAYARTALALDPSLPAAYHQLARIFMQNGQTDEAASTLGRGLRRRLLSPASVIRDPVLDSLIGHPVLAPYF